MRPLYLSKEIVESKEELILAIEDSARGETLRANFGARYAIETLRLNVPEEFKGRGRAQGKIKNTVRYGADTLEILYLVRLEQGRVQMRFQQLRVMGPDGTCLADVQVGKTFNMDHPLQKGDYTSVETILDLGVQTGWHSPPLWLVPFAMAAVHGPRDQKLLTKCLVEAKAVRMDLKSVEQFLQKLGFLMEGPGVMPDLSGMIEVARTGQIHVQQVIAYDYINNAPIRFHGRTFTEFLMFPHDLSLLKQFCEKLTHYQSTMLKAG